MCVFVGYRQCGFTFPRVTGVDMRGKAFVILFDVPVSWPGRIALPLVPVAAHPIDPSAMEGM